MKSKQDEEAEVSERGAIGVLQIVGLAIGALVILIVGVALGSTLFDGNDSANAKLAADGEDSNGTTQTSTATIPPALLGTGTVPTATATRNQGSWNIQEIDLANDPVVAQWLAKLRDPDPSHWKTFPNVPNPDVPEFRVVNGTQVPDGVEYGVDNVPFCQQDQRCDFIVPGWHYRLITGDYGFLNLSCQGDGKKGCLLLLVNVMDQSFTWRDQRADNGFTVAGRYWNGDTLEWGVWGLVSHASANMLNMPTIRNPNTGDILNAGGSSSNAGANCGHQPDACGSVDATVVVHAGDRVLAVAKTTVSG